MLPNTNTPTDYIRGDRRANRRYDLNLRLRYKLTRGKRVLEMGTGHTVDISSGGVAFAADQPLREGVGAEIWVDWPAALNGYGMRLVMRGRIVRAEGSTAAMRVDKHEFRLAGVRQPPAPQPGAHTGEARLFTMALR